MPVTSRGHSDAGRLPSLPVAGDLPDLLPDLLPDMLFARPKEAVAAAGALLARSPSPYDASIAHQVLGIFHRDFGEPDEAFRHLRLALRHARRSRSANREADVLATFGVAHVVAGRTGLGLRRLDEAAARSTGTTQAHVLFRRGGALAILGRHQEALADLRAAVPILRAADDTIWTARALTLRALISLALGATRAAEADFRAAEELWSTTDQEHDIAVAVQNRGLAAYRIGDLPAALGHLEEAAKRFAALGTPAPDLSAYRCGVLLDAGLARDALAEADEAIGRLERRGGLATLKAELLLIAARAALAADEPATAIARAGQAARLFARQRRDWWRAHARLVLLQARFAAGRVTGRLVSDAAAVAERLAELRSPESVRAHLLAGRAALALGRGARADRHLAQAARGRLRGPAMARAEGWLAEALRAHAAGNTRRVLHACRRGLDLLDEHRLTLGAAEPRALAAAQGAELAALAQLVCLDSGRPPRDLLAWSERWRATALAVPRVSPPDDQELSGQLTAFREITGLLEQARSSGSPYTALQREQRRLERAIRARTLRVPGAKGVGARRFDTGELLAALGPHTLVEIVSVEGRLHVLLCAAGRVQRLAAGTLAEAVGEVEHARSLLRRFAFGAPVGDRMAVLDATAARLERILLGPAARQLGDGPVVVVPPGRLHGVPWTLLPALRDRAVTVCPSAGAWLAARAVPPPPNRDVVLVGGPGLRTRAAELPALTDLYATLSPAAGAPGGAPGGPIRARVLRDGEARAGRVLEAIDGAWLAHIAAHGEFRADSPLFSSMLVDDGPLTVHDFERLRRAPYRLILPSCDLGRLAPVGADELLGLAAALFPLGTAGLAACLVPVNDEAVVPLMLALHERLAAGVTLAEAMRDARRGVGDDPLHLATAWSFTVMGAV